jgi:hypothetical protein
LRYLRIRLDEGQAKLDGCSCIHSGLVLPAGRFPGYQHLKFCQSMYQYLPYQIHMEPNLIGQLSKLPIRNGYLDQRRLSQ